MRSKTTSTPVLNLNSIQIEPTIMNTNIKFNTIIFLLCLLAACGSNQSDNHDAHDHEEHGNHEEDKEEVRLSMKSVKALDLKLGKVKRKQMGKSVQVNGMLEVPPNNEAIVTAVLGGNASDIKVIEGDSVGKGEVLCYLSHPSIVKVQSDFLENKAELEFLESEYERQERLFKEEVGSGRELQETRAKLNKLRAALAGGKMKLSQIGIDPNRLEADGIRSKIPVRSPIQGFVSAVQVRTGQYVQPDSRMFELVNLHHIHADFMVYERDIAHIRKGQIVRFNTQALPDKNWEGIIYTIGKKFEQEPKAVHIHVEIYDKTRELLPGMYVSGQVFTDSSQMRVLPREAVVAEEDKEYVFLCTKKGEDEWHLSAIEVKSGRESGDMIEVSFTKPLADTSLFALNAAYFLMSEMKKGEGGHGHHH